jgi:16S rRNA G966 N2-methylase RsmD
MNVTTVDPAAIRIGERVRVELGDLKTLRASINSVGLMHPIVVTPSMDLVAGRRRLAALSLDPAWESVPVNVAATLAEASDAILMQAENDENACRADLTEVEKAIMAAHLQTIYAVNAGQRKGGRGKTSADSADVSRTERESRAKAAKAVGSSHDTITKVAKVLELAADEQQPEPVRERAKKAAANLAKPRAKVSREYHDTMAVLRDTTNAAKIEQIGREHTDDLITVHNCDFRDLQIQPGSARMIFTDPPYPDEYLPLWADLGERAAEWLTPGGILMTYAPHKHLPRILHDLGEHLDWWWCYAVVHDGAWGKVRDRWVQCGWKPVLGFVKAGGHPAHRLPNDIILERRKDKSLHRWQQATSEAAYWIEAYTDPGDLVVEPFAGSGTTLAAAKDLGRRGIGAEIDPAAYVTTVERVS